MATRPILIKPESEPFTDTQRAQLVNGGRDGNVPGSPISVDLVHMRPGQATDPQHHPDTWVYLLIRQASPLGAIIRHGPGGNELNPAPGQLVAIPPAVHFSLINPSEEHGHDVLAYEFRAAVTSTDRITAASPTLIRTDHCQFTLSEQGQPLATLIDGRADGNLPTSPASAGLVRMTSRHVAEPHRHDTTWVYVLLWEAGPLGAVTVHGPDLGESIHQAVGQIIVMPPGEAHAAINPSHDHGVIGIEFRANPTIHTDNVVLEDLRSNLDQPLLFDLVDTAAR